MGQYSELVTQLPTRAFLAPLEADEQVEVQLGEGASATIRLKAAGELQPGGKREVVFEANGVPQWVALRGGAGAGAGV